jgi:hypothetical protein
VLVALTADDAVDLYTFTPGSLKPSGVHLTGITRPGPIVMRDDGMEALAVYGGLGAPFGVAAITVSPDGSSAQVEQVLQIGTDTTAVSVAYSDHDHAIAALQSDKFEVVGLTRQGSHWVAGTRVPAPATYPLQVKSLPNSTDVLLSRSQVGVDATLDIYRMRASSGTWSAVGAPVSVTDGPFAMALNANGAAFYVPSDDSSNPITPQNLTAGGKLHAVTIGTNAFSDAGTIALSHVGYLIAADPRGRFVVVDGDVFMLDGNGQPNVSQYVWQTVKLDSNGALKMAYATTMPHDGLLFEDLQITSTGHLLATRVMYPNAVPPAMQNPLEVWAQPAWGEWQLCDTVYLDNGAHLAIAL